MQNQYNLTMRIMHWLLGILIIGMLISGLIMVRLPDTDIKWEVYGIHKSFGLIALVFIIFRICVRFLSKVPDYPVNINKLEIFVAKVTHKLIYVFMLSAPISGYLGSALSGYDVKFFNFTLPVFFSVNKELGKAFGDLHNFSTDILLYLVILHILAFLKHLIFNKENLLKRIW